MWHFSRGEDVSLVETEYSLEKQKQKTTKKHAIWTFVELHLDYHHHNCMCGKFSLDMCRRRFRFSGLPVLFTSSPGFFSIQFSCVFSRKKTHTKMYMFRPNRRRSPKRAHVFTHQEHRDLNTRGVGKGTCPRQRANADINMPRPARRQRAGSQMGAL